MKNPMTSLRQNYGGLSSSIYVLFVARIINRMGGFVHAFLALYLATKLGYDDNKIANYIVIVGALSSFAPFIGGRIADVRGRKTIYLTAQTIAALLFIPCGFLTNTNPELVPMFLIAASVISSIIGPINNAMVADLTKTPQERKTAISLLYLGINVGVAIGPIVGGFLLDRYVFWFFIGDAMTTLIAVVLVALFVKETQLTHEEMKQADGGETMEKGFTLFVLLKKPILVAYIIFATLNSVVYAQSNFGFSLYMAEIFGDSRGPSNYGILMSFNALTVLLFTVIITEILRNNKPIINIMYASILYTIGFGMYAFIDQSFLLLFIPTFIWTIGEIIAVTNGSVFVFSHTPVNYRGRFSAIIGFIMGSGYIFSPKIMSFFTSNYSYQLAWLFIGVLAMIAALGFFMISRFDKVEGTQEALNVD